MPHITLPDHLPGITGPLAQYPETARPLGEFTQVLLRNATPGLSAADRELIAAYVSTRNECVFCSNAHSAAARELLGENASLVDHVKADLDTAPITPKMRALLRIAGKVQRDGRSVTSDDIMAARALDADDRDIHDTVLIAAAFCMFNRYVDGLATWTPDDPAIYAGIGKQLAEQGYETGRGSERPQ